MAPTCEMLQHNVHTQSTKRGTAMKRRSSTSEPWYAKNPWLSTQAALTQQRRVLEQISLPAHATQLDETDLFKALHTSAFRYGRAKVGSAARHRWLADWMQIRDYLVEVNLGLAYSMVSRFTSAQADADELVSEAMYGLYRGVERYDPWKGYRFSTYACNCIARACLRHRKQQQRQHEYMAVMFDVPWNPVTEKPDEATGLHLERLRHVMDSNVAELNSIEKRILDERFPFSDAPARTLQQIAGLVGLSKERVRQIQNIALDKLKTAMQEDAFLQ